jgi:hypothetical protein
MRKLCLRVLASLWVLSAGCGDSGGTPAQPEDPSANEDPGTYLPKPSDFARFHEWDSFPNDAVEGAPPHDATLGPMTVYINKLPAPGSTEFEVGTLIVKETNEDDPTVRRVFARAKRGGKYNKSGAVGWEWFELANNANGTVAQRWRGLGPPPPGEEDSCTTGYGGDAKGGCNACHLPVSDNDYVWTTGLQLSDF